MAQRDRIPPSHEAAAVPPPRLELQHGDCLQLSLFDPSLDSVFPDDLVQVEKSGRTKRCQCSTRVVELTDDQLILTLPVCERAAYCFHAGRRLYGLTVDGRRTSFSCVVQKNAGDADRCENLLHVSNPSDIRSGQRRRAYRVPVFPEARLRVETWMLKHACEGHEAVHQLFRGHPWSENWLPQPVRNHYLKGLIVDLSVNGIGIAVRRPAVETLKVNSLLLIRYQLPSVPRQLAQISRVNWLKPWSNRILRLGCAFLPNASEAIDRGLEECLADWVYMQQRRELQQNHTHACRLGKQPTRRP
ncbi:PilZ domain-containing protein [Mucisphaera sp.]|uniref:PilZ domain-containing protein n=1 Tax=Mucisphaera sp. TaxID=2913024 RepID=UPI003D0F41C7